MLQTSDEFQQALETAQRHISSIEMELVLECVMRNQSRRAELAGSVTRDQPAIAGERYRKTCQDEGGNREAGRMLTRCA
jgi:hypothetical protein